MKMLEKVLRKVCGRSNSNKAENDDKNKIKGTVVLRKKNVMDVTDLGASVIDRVHELFGKGVMLKLISAVHGDPANENKGKLGRAAYLENWVSKITSLSAEDEAAFTVTFHLDSDSASSFGFPGAFSVRNYHHSQFYLKSLTLHDFPGHGSIHFVCNSWVYPAHRYKHDRVFFSNETYLPSETPKPLIYYREQELKVLRGTGSAKLREWDRTYDYAYYNDLGSPEKGESYRRPVLGGSEEYPYPRRGRTGRGPNKKDPETESRLFLLSLNMYVPRDEKFDQVKFSDFIAYALKSLGQVLAPEIRAAFDKTPNEFDSFEDVLRLYSDGFEISRHRAIERIRECVPLELIRELLRSDGERCLKFPMPDVIKENKTAWRTDEEFGREMLAGVNPVIIRRLEEFPPKSKLDPQIYGNQNSTITREHVEKHMHGLTVDQAIADHRLFILDHHDSLIPYLRRINSTTTKTYASRTLLLLQDNGTLKPLAIELSLPNEDGDIYGSSSQVFTPCDDRGIGDSIWQLAKAYVSVNDSGYHQLISHWLNTHATIEPFVIASNRQLSAVHPIYKLLQPHFRDTMYINALARQILINAGGVLEVTVFPSKYAMEMSSFVYRSWDFTEQALPIDLLKRGMAVINSNEPHGLRLVIEDYPYAVDGLEIWHAIESWVEEYCSLYYTTDDLVQLDPELQSWWKEIREVGHGDLKHEPWWPDLQTRGDLIRVCTITIWIVSALHAAVNFGQYPYAGYLPNRPTVSRRLMPEPGSVEYAELERNPDLAYLKTITPQFQTLLGISLIEILSRHSTDEIYLGQREDHLNWTSDDRAREAFKRFGSKLVEIESKITERNKDKRFKNRAGPVNVPYTLLYPNTSDHSRQGGLTGKGIPNSVSI